MARRPLTRIIRIRITEEHRRLLAAAAEAEGQDLSNWLRQLAIRAARAIQPSLLEP